MDPTTVPYCGAPPVPTDLLARWNLDPILLAVLVGGFALCWMARGPRAPQIAGFSVLAILFVSPLCALSSALFAVRVTDHVILTTLAAPLLALAFPRGRGGLVGWTLAHGLVFWAWHAPAAYGLALASPWAYWLMQASLLGTALGFWRAVLAAPAPAAIAGLLATMVQMGLLGALLTFAGTPIYAWHGATTLAWGLTPLEDQQLAGLIMWVPGAAVYLLSALRIASGWLDERQRLQAA